MTQKLNAAKYFLILAAFVFAACSSISLNQKITLSPGDWIMAGGSSQQHNVSSAVLKPPLDILWRYNCDAGIGCSALSVADAVVFVNTLQGEMHSIDISSGNKIGQINFLGKEANSTPLIDENNIITSYAGDNKYSLASYNLLIGEINWRVNFGYLETSPVLYENNVYIGSLRGKEYKINKSNGQLVWSFNAGSAVHSTCAVMNNKIVFGTDGGFLYCLNASNGFKLWKINLNNSIFSAPLILENKVYIGSYDSNYYCIGLDSGSVIWKQNLSTKIFTGSALFKNSFLMFGGVNGILYCLNSKTGELEWKFGTKGVITSTPLVSGENIYFSSFDRSLYCLNGNDGKMVWSYELEGKSKTSPVIWSNYLFAASDYYLYCFTDLKNVNK